MIHKIIILIFLISIATCSESNQETTDERVYKSLEVFKNFQENLQNELKAGIEKGGVHGAVSFCKIKSSELETKAGLEGMTVKRISDKPRNPDHSPDDWEISVLQSWKAKLDNREKITIASTTTPDGKFRVMQPILIKNSMCLSCHGDPKTMQPPTLEILNKLYPKDKAKGYAMHDLRGAFSATWMSKNK